MPRVKVNDIEMYYEILGEGPPLVMLHGFNVSSNLWRPFIPEYKEHFQLILPDLRGHGRSTNPSREFTHRQSALDIYALLDHLEVKKFSGMGISSGSMTLIHMATQQPERIQDMVLMAGTSYFPKECRQIQAQKSAENISDERWEFLRRIHHYGDDQIKMLIDQFHRMKDSYDDMNFTKPYLSTIQAKTLIVHGDRDEYFPVEIPVTLYNSIPNSYLWIIPNMNHTGLVLPKPTAEIIKGCLDFLTNTWKVK
jgi:pimeloyl-ACP methyl ester carboxylesterase